jgi:hypothetical protein
MGCLQSEQKPLEYLRQTMDISNARHTTVGAMCCCALLKNLVRIVH